MMYLRNTEESSTGKLNLIKRCDSTGGHAYSTGVFVGRKDGMLKVGCICPRCNSYYEREAGYDEIRELLNGNRWFGIG
jgi:hypothetical protein